jgi:hypothetical protein
VYQSDPNLSVPADDTPLWRYLDFARFMALLESASLWFAPADTFSDQYELAVPAADMPAARSGAAAILADGRTRDGIVRYLAAITGRPGAELAGLPDEVAGLLLRFASQALYISCWQEDEDESAGMWESFVQGNNGVAVRTTFGALRGVLDAGSADRDVFLGRVEYLDYRAGSWASSTGSLRPSTSAASSARSRKSARSSSGLTTGAWPTTPPISRPPRASPFPST